MSKHAKLALRYWAAIDEGHRVKWWTLTYPEKKLGCSGSHPTFHDDLDYQIEILPRKMRVNGLEILEGLREAPPAKTLVYVAVPAADEWAQRLEFYPDSRQHCMLLARGLLHDCESAAIAHAKAMVGIGAQS